MSAEPKGPDPIPPDYETAVIGAGFAGLAAALNLLDAGRTSFVVFERAAEVGGVWRDNVYPGCACDVRSHLYSLAARPNPDWASTYASQPDILAYLRRIAGEAAVASRISFDTEILEARFLEDQGHWRLLDARGGVHHVRTLILALGPLNRPALPAIPGLERFGGAIRHSCAWDASLALSGKRVAVVGTGASGIQIVPNIADEVERLTVFQRSAAWVLPRGDRRIGKLERWLFRRAPVLQRIVRSAIFWLMEGVGTAFFGNRPMHRLLVAVALRKLRREVRDPATRLALTPDYTLGCKRMTVSDDYYAAFNRSNVTLVVDPIGEITETGIRTRGGALHEVDHIVFTTGFVVADPDAFLRVVGPGGRVLAEQWAAEGAQAHRGVTVSGYPNLLMLLGPNSGLSYASAVYVVESQLTYVRQYLDALDRAGPTAALDVQEQVQDAYNTGLQAKLAHTVWASGCRSWYISRSGRNNHDLSPPDQPLSPADEAVRRGRLRRAAGGLGPVRSRRRPGEAPGPQARWWGSSTRPVRCMKRSIPSTVSVIEGSAMAHALPARAAW